MFIDYIIMSNGFVVNDISQVNFVLTAFESQFTLAQAATLPSHVTAMDVSATITLTYTVTQAIMQETFYYRTDVSLNGDMSYNSYYVDKSKWSDLATTINPYNGIVTANGFQSNDKVSKDFIRYLAHKLFGTYLGADLFTNEDAVESDIASKCSGVATTIHDLIGSLDKSSTAPLPGHSVDEFGSKYFKDVNDTRNISRELFSILTTSAPGRFKDISGNKLNAVEDGFYKMPIIAGDKLSYKLIIQPAADQTTVVKTGADTIPPRTYAVILNVVN